MHLVDTDTDAAADPALQWLHVAGTVTDQGCELVRAIWVIWRGIAAIEAGHPGRRDLGTQLARALGLVDKMDALMKATEPPADYRLWHAGIRLSLLSVIQAHQKVVRAPQSVEAADAAGRQIQKAYRRLSWFGRRVEAARQARLARLPA